MNTAKGQRTGLLLESGSRMGRRLRLICVRVPLLGLGLSTMLIAQDPWTDTATKLKDAFTGPIAAGLVAVAVVVTGLTFAFSEGGGKRQMAGLMFGAAMALGAVKFIAWLFY